LAPQFEFKNTKYPILHVLTIQKLKKYTADSIEVEAIKSYIREKEKKGQDLDTLLFIRISNKRTLLFVFLLNDSL
jgi:hypothetical protein